MKNIIPAILIIITVIIFNNTTARAQATSTGTYTTYVGGQQFGLETYTLLTSADNSRKSESEISFGGTKFKITTAVAADGRPLSFTLEMNGAQALSQEFTSDGVKVRAAGQAERLVKAQPRALLENGAWHQFLFLFPQYDVKRGGRQSFDAFLPSQALGFALTLERVDAPSFNVKGKPFATEHFRAATDLGLSFEIWTDATYTPLLIAVPSQGITVVRKGAEDLAAAVFPAATKAAAPGSPNDPYASEEVVFHNGEQKLAGTLTIPKNGSAPFPAAVIISGSGSQDRDGSTINNIYRLVAERLSANGVAVLRADDRGAGASTPTKTTASYRDLVNDTRAALDYLTTRGEIDKKRLALVGHSEGAETAAIIAAEDARVAAVALLAGASRPVDRVVVEQTIFNNALQRAVDPSDRTQDPAIARRIIELFDKAKADPKGAGADADKLAWFREHAASDPSQTIKRVHVPVLILNGERDALVLPYHALELARALGDAGNKRVTLRIFPNLSHLFTPSPLDGCKTGDKASEVSLDFLLMLQKWMSDTLAASK